MTFLDEGIYGQYQIHFHSKYEQIGHGQIFGQPVCLRKSEKNGN